MFNHKQRLFAATAELVAIALGVVLLAGTGLAQSNQPDTPGACGQHAMMASHMGHGRWMQATAAAADSVPVTSTATCQHGARGMMGRGTMGQAMLGRGMMWRHGMMRQGTMEHGTISQGLGAAATVTKTLGATQAGVPERFPATLKAADAKRGQQLTVSNACSSCHSLEEAQMAVGPTWDEMAETAATRVEGMSAEEYLYTSIVHPNAYVVPGYQSNVMIQVYGRTLGEQDLADIVRYLLTLRD